MSAAIVPRRRVVRSRPAELGRRRRLAHGLAGVLPGVARPTPPRGDPQGAAGRPPRSSVQKNELKSGATIELKR
jgi:hypothetical protein